MIPVPVPVSNQKLIGELLRDVFEWITCVRFPSTQLNAISVVELLLLLIFSVSCGLGQEDDVELWWALFVDKKKN